MPRRHVKTELIVLLAAFASFHGLKVVLCGMESALAFALVSWSLHGATAWKRPVPFPLLVGLAVTARWTNGLLLLPLFGTWWLDRSGRERLIALIVAAAPALVCLSASWKLTGALFPVSAAIKTGHSSSPFVIAAVAVVIAGLTWAWAKRRSERAHSTARAFALGVALLVGADVALRGTVLPEIWTLWPHLLLASLWAPLIPRTLAVAGLVLAGAVAVWSWRHRLRPEATTAYEAAARSGEWLNEHMTATGTAAGWDVGFIAGHSTGRVVNLDGLVNSWDYKRRVLDTDQLDEYLANELKPEFIAQDLPILVLRADPQVRFKGATLAGWFVQRSECFEFVGATRPWLRQHKVAVVLSRTALTENDRTLGQQRLELCHAEH